MAQPFFHAGQHRGVVAGLGIDHPVGRQPRLFQPGREQVGLRHAPQDRPAQPRRDPGRETRRRRAIDRAITTARHLVQTPQCQPALRQPPVQRVDPKGQHPGRRRPRRLKPGDAGAQWRDGGMGR